MIWIIKDEWDFLKCLFVNHLEWINNIKSKLNFSISFLINDMSLYLMLMSCIMILCHDLFLMIWLRLLIMKVQIFLYNINLFALFLSMMIMIKFCNLILFIVVTMIAILIFLNTVFIFFLIFMKLIYVSKWLNITMNFFFQINGLKKNLKTVLKKIYFLSLHKQNFSNCLKQWFVFDQRHPQAPWSSLLSLFLVIRP